MNCDSVFVGQARLPVPLNSRSVETMKDSCRRARAESSRTDSPSQGLGIKSVCPTRQIQSLFKNEVVHAGKSLGVHSRPSWEFRSRHPICIDFAQFCCAAWVRDHQETVHEN